MSDERKRCSDVTPDDVDGRTVDRWPVDIPGTTQVEPGLYRIDSLLPICNAPLPDPLDDLMAIRGCEGCP